MDSLEVDMGVLYLLDSLDMRHLKATPALPKNVPDSLGHETAIAVICSVILVVINSSLVGHKPMDIMV